MEAISLEKLQASVGTEIGVSPWRVVSQTVIDAFADATDDHQFIHVDYVRTANETPFGGTIAPHRGGRAIASRKWPNSTW